MDTPYPMSNSSYSSHSHYSNHFGMYMIHNNERHLERNIMSAMFCVFNCYGAELSEETILEGVRRQPFTTLLLCQANLDSDIRKTCQL